jgi:hypothetical protein
VWGSKILSENARKIKKTLYFQRLVAIVTKWGKRKSRNKQIHS